MASALPDGSPELEAGALIFMVKPRQTKAAGRGFRSFQSDRTRILLSCGKLDLSRSGCKTRTFHRRTIKPPLPKRLIPGFMGFPLGQFFAAALSTPC
jgi:hypothetical protein